MNVATMVGGVATAVGTGTTQIAASLAGINSTPASLTVMSETISVPNVVGLTQAAATASINGATACWSVALVLQFDDVRYLGSLDNLRQAADTLPPWATR